MRRMQMWVGRGLRIGEFQQSMLGSCTYRFQISRLRLRYSNLGPEPVVCTYSNTDIPAHSYQLSFESNVEWSKFYAGAPEILEYWRKVADKYDIRKYMKFNQKCIEARWNEETCKWHAKFQKVGSDEIIEDVGDVFMTGSGVLNEWKWPDIKGLHDFKGKLMHSANWDTSYDVTVCLLLLFSD